MDGSRRVCVIVNPASGVNREGLAQIKAFLAAQPNLTAEVFTTVKSGDARRFAKEAAADGFDLVAAYGGDGTQMEAADGLRETGVPLAILPGGTANVMAVELGIPLDLGRALTLMAGANPQPRCIDMGVLDGAYFLLRAGIGYEAEMSAQTAREEKSKSGRWAYFKNSFRKMRNLRQHRYIITVDGVTHVERGITCMICNSSSIGIPNLRLVSADVGDGLLDVVVVASMRPGSVLRVILSILMTVLPGSARPSLIANWQGRQITVETHSRQLIARDGELLKRAKRVTARVAPQVLNVIVPSGARAAG